MLLLVALDFQRLISLRVQGGDYQLLNHVGLLCDLLNKRFHQPQTRLPSKQVCHCFDRRLDLESCLIEPLFGL